VTGAPPLAVTKTCPDSVAGPFEFDGAEIAMWSLPAMMDFAGVMPTPHRRDAQH
jgi:hypothetical protein